jgi:glutaredoxin 3
MKIVVYASPSCPHSNQLLKFFKRKKVEFEMLDVMDDHKLWGDLLTKTSQLSTPVIEVDDEIFIGFDEAKIWPVIKSKKR